jgi:hypothetical protein
VFPLIPVVEDAVTVIAPVVPEGVSVVLVVFSDNQGPFRKVMSDIVKVGVAAVLETFFGAMLG